MLCFRCDAAHAPAGGRPVAGPPEAYTASGRLDERRAPRTARTRRGAAAAAAGAVTEAVADDDGTTTGRWAAVCR